MTKETSRIYDSATKEKEAYIFKSYRHKKS